jgi:hypothetical protein
MAIRIHPHARERMWERGASEDEVLRTIEAGERFLAKFNRIGFRRNFTFEGLWKGKQYKTKQVEVYTVEENEDLIAITILVKYF